MAPPFTIVAHGDLALWNPLPAAETFALVDSLDVAASARALDVGCGRAELLIRLLARTGASGVGVDSSPHAVALARAAAAGRVPSSRLELREAPFDAMQFADASFDLALCVGATHAAGGLRETLRALRRLLVPGGLAIVGEGHWRREPDAEYLEAIGATRDELLDHAGNVAVARAEGFDVARTLDSSTADFDEYETAYAANVERWAAARPDDADAGAYLARIRSWRAAYLRWGRETLGFALHLLRRSDAVSSRP